MSKAKSQPCLHCGRPGLQTKLVTRSYGKGAALLLIEGIPIHSCPHCGETYLTADTLHEIERIRALRKAVSVVRPVSVATFAQGGLTPACSGLAALAADARRQAVQVQALRYFEALIPHFPNASSLALLGRSDATMLLARFPTLPDEYLRFLTEIGHGDLGPLVLYSSPIAPAVVYSEARATSLEGIVLFGDDMQGYCYGFDLSDDGRVVEIDPRGVVDRTIEPSFGRFLRALLVANT